jgi:hypothetical protein
MTTLLAAAHESAPGPSRQSGFFGPTVANGALRTWLDLRFAPRARRCRVRTHESRCHFAADCVYRLRGRLPQHDDVVVFLSVSCR